TVLSIDGAVNAGGSHKRNEGLALSSLGKTGQEGPTCCWQL
ncbi:unnamed protein product, partial [Heterotrigona itama]